MPRAKAKPRQPAYKDMTIDDVRAMVKTLREEGLQIQSHYKRLEQEYSDWEDRLYALDKIISQAEEETGLTKEQIIEPDDPFMEFMENDDSEGQNARTN